MSTVIPNVYFRILDANGVTIPGGKMYWYAAGTSTPATVYSDSGLSTPLANPIIADSGGAIVPIYAADGSYKVVVTDASGAILYTLDNYTIATAGGGSVNVSAPVVLKTANYTVQASDRNAVFICDASSVIGQNITITADSGTLGNGFPFTVVDYGSAGTVTIVGVSAQTVNQSTSLTLNGQNQAATFVSNGATGWVTSASSTGTFLNPVTFYASATFNGAATFGAKAQFNGIVAYKEQTITWVSSPATTTFDPSLGPDASLTLSGAALILGPIANQSTNVGARGQLRIAQDATGGRTVAFDSTFASVDGSPITLNAAASSETKWFYWVKASSGAGSVILYPIVPNGVRVLLSRVSASNSASLSDTTSLISGYRSFDIEFENLVPVSTNAALFFKPQVSASYQSPQVMGVYADGGSNGGFSNTTGQITNSTSVVNTAAAGVSGSIKIMNAASASVRKNINFQFGGTSGSGPYATYFGTLFYTGSNGAVTGFQITMTSNISTGVLSVWGYN